MVEIESSSSRVEPASDPRAPVRSPSSVLICCLVVVDFFGLAAAWSWLLDASTAWSWSCEERIRTRLGATRAKG
jgi:hypothetical protein